MMDRALTDLMLLHIVHSILCRVVDNICSVYMYCTHS
jgi:hypothetical protein